MKLEEGELICPKCDGGGSYPKKFAKLEDPYYCHCNKCFGTGKLDWIELCMGKKFESLIFGQPPYVSITFPEVRKKYPKLIAKDLVSIQPIDWGTDET